MLNKSICIKCRNSPDMFHRWDDSISTNKDKFADLIARDDSWHDDEAIWEIRKRVWCPYKPPTINEPHLSIYSEPPKNCPFVLEHLVSKC